MKWIALVCFLVVGVLSPGGCAGGAPRGGAPDEFSLSLTVLGTRSATGTPMEAAWYVVEPDGALRVAVGGRQATSGVPPRVRQLTRTQMDALWSRVEAWRGWAPAQGGNRPEEAIGATALISIAWAGNDRRSYRIDLAGESAASESVRQAVIDLREMAWMTR